jgi:hypothetical protein
MTKTLETIGGMLLLVVAAYCGWRLLILGARLREKVRGEPEPPPNLFDSKRNSK